MSDLARLNLSPTTRDWLSDSALEPIAEPYAVSLAERGYAVTSRASYLAGIAHFGHWLASRRYGLADIDEVAVAKFLDGHLL